MSLTPVAPLLIVIRLGSLELSIYALLAPTAFSLATVSGGRCNDAAFTTKREVGNISNSLFGKGVDERIILPVRDIIKILDADNWRDGLRLRDLLGGHSTYPEMLYQTFLLHFGEHAERLSDRTWLRCIEAADPQIDDIERAETEVREIITNGLAELFGSERSGPISFRVPPRADLRDDR